jgi:hypothetical protein
MADGRENTPGRPRFSPNAGFREFAAVFLAVGVSAGLGWFLRQWGPRSPRDCMIRGEAWCVKKDYSSAISDFTEAIRLDPTSARAYTARAYPCIARKD